jgi:ABC-type nitrate/sulfonate/bicarbonate transport system substrate-binding protein
VVVGGLVAAGCGGSAGASHGAKSGTIRFVFSDDPVWDYMKDTGKLQDMEKESGIKIQDLTTDDEFGLFAGGHADIVSTGSYETPLYDTKGIPTVTFGKYNMNKDLLVTNNPKYKTASDLPKGCKVASESPTGNTIIWASLIKRLDHRELGENSKDLKLVSVDYQIMPTLVNKGSVCAAISDPTQATSGLRENKIHGMYDGKSAAQLYSENVVKGHEGVMSNNFVARKAWFDANPKEAAFFLKVWQVGLDLWNEKHDEIISKEPKDFAIQNDADEAFIKEYNSRSKFALGFVDSVYLTKDWIDGEKPVFDLIQEAGEIPKDATLNESAVVDPTTGKVTDRIGGKGGSE